MQKSPRHKLAIGPVTQPAAQSWHARAEPSANPPQTSPGLQGAGTVALTKSKSKRKAKGSDGTLERILAEISHSSLETHAAIGIESPLPPEALAESSAVQRAAVLHRRGNMRTIPFPEINPLKNTRNFILKTSSCTSQAAFQLQTLWIPGLKTEQQQSQQPGEPNAERGEGKARGEGGEHFHQETMFPCTMQVLQFCLQMATSISSKSISCY